MGAIRDGYMTTYLIHHWGIVICAGRGRDVSLLVANVLMGGMNSLELSRELAKRSVPPVTLHYASDTGGVLADRGVLGQHVEVLQLPVTAEVLGERIRALLEARPVS
jgi:hypothetical protein